MTDTLQYLNEFLAGTPRRDERGRWLPGASAGPGRPKGFDFRQAVAKALEARGDDPAAAMVQVYDMLLAQSLRGDVAAAKLLLDRLVGKEPEVIDAVIATKRLSPVERATRIQGILADIARRRAN